MVGCGSSAAAPSAPTGSVQSQGKSGAQQLRDKLNAMSVPDRLAYLKQHPESTRQMMGAAPGGGPMGAGGAPSPKGP